MRRNALTRITTVLYAVWLVVTVGAQTTRPCPMHDGATHVTIAGMAMAPGTDAGLHASSHGSSSGTAHHACTCAECCCLSAIDMGAPATVHVPASRMVATALRVPGAACVAPTARASRLLPLANAPPSASSVTV